MEQIDHVEKVLWDVEEMDKYDLFECEEEVIEDLERVKEEIGRVEDDRWLGETVEEDGILRDELLNAPVHVLDRVTDCLKGKFAKEYTRQQKLDYVVDTLRDLVDYLYKLEANEVDYGVGKALWLKMLARGEEMNG